MTYSTSPKFLLGFLLAYLLVFPLTAKFVLAVSERTVELTVQYAQVVSRLQLKPNGRPRWAQFSPANPNLILLDVDGQGVIASLPTGITRTIPGGMLPVGWLGPAVVVRAQTGQFQLLDPADLTPSKTVKAGTLSLPWPFGKNRQLTFDVASGRETKRPALVAREHAGLSIDTNGDGLVVRDAAGKLVFQGQKKIYGITSSPDGSKFLVYYGNTDHILFNRLTRRVTKLPSTIDEWTWFPDSSTLLGQVSVSGDARFEEVVRTDLYIFDPLDGKLDKIELPSQVQGAALHVLDVSSAAKILVEAERIVPDRTHLGVMVFDLKRTSAGN